MIVDIRKAWKEFRAFLFDRFIRGEFEIVDEFHAKDILHLYRDEP